MTSYDHLTMTATNTNAEHRSPTGVASKSDFIPNVYRYCDRWCEKCPFSSRCLVYATDQESHVSLASLEAENEEFWRRQKSYYQEAREMIAGWAREASVDFSRPAFEGKEQRRRIVDNHPLTKAAKKYGKNTDDGVRELKEGVNATALGEEALQAIDVIQWYQYHIAVKIMRAFSERWEGDEEEDLPKDSDGAAKVALVGIERSIGAWYRLNTIVPMKAVLITHFILQLERLRVEVEREFPGAVRFVRPGFDEVPGQTQTSVEVMPEPIPQRGRVERRNVAKLYSAAGAYVYELNPDRKQFFCETRAAWELWDETELLRRVQRWSKKRIGFVIFKDEKHEAVSAGLPTATSTAGEVSTVTTAAQ